MITNSDIHKLLEVECVADFIKNNDMKHRVCRDGDENLLILYSLPYAIEIVDRLIENYLEIYLVNLEEERMIQGESAIQYCLEMGFQSIDELRMRKFDGNPQNAIFLSSKVEKMRALSIELESIEMLLPVLRKKGLKALDTGDFDERIDVGRNTNSLPIGLKERYAKCGIGEQ